MPMDCKELDEDCDAICDRWDAEAKASQNAQYPGLDESYWDKLREENLRKYLEDTKDAEAILRLAANTLKEQRLADENTVRHTWASAMDEAQAENERIAQLNIAQRGSLQDGVFVDGFPSGSGRIRNGVVSDHYFTEPYRMETAQNRDSIENRGNEVIQHMYDPEIPMGYRNGRVPKLREIREARRTAENTLGEVPDRIVTQKQPLPPYHINPPGPSPSPMYEAHPDEIDLARRDPWRGHRATGPGGNTGGPIPTAVQTRDLLRRILKKMGA